DIIQSILDTINTTWESNSASSLIRCDLSNLIPGSLDGTIGELYDNHHRDRSAQAYFGNVPQKWRQMKGEFVCFELHIDVSHVRVSSMYLSPSETN
ncbi:hypothetical protein B0H10DRAFT_1847552, partial [Mycena sp. CBHHK59/15]